MNKKPKNTPDASAPYRNLGLGMITAPVKPQDKPKSRTIKGGNDDLRCKRGKA